MNTATPEVLLRIANLECAYGPVRALHGISLEVARGSIVTVLGANGAGKSTVLKAISGVILPQKGTVSFAGQEITGWRPVQIVRAGIAHSPEGREVFALLSVHDNLMMGAFILSNTRWEWSAADFGILLAGGVSCGIYPTDAAVQVHYLCADSATQVLFVENDEQLDKALAVRAQLPLLRQIVVTDMDGLHDLVDAQVMGLQDLMERGREYASAHPGELALRVASRGANDLAILIYTSGTTGKPKGAMLSHRNVCYMMETYAPALAQGPGDDKMAFLPLCHVVERLAGQMLSLQTGSRLNYVENPDTVIDNLREIAPTALLAVPRIWEKLYSMSTLSVKDATALQQWAYHLALKAGYAAADCEEQGQPVGPLLRLQWWLARVLVLNNTRRFLGLQRIRWAITGAAPISPNVIRWYRALGVNLLEGYGMTESTGGGTMGLPGATRIGTVGRPQALNELRLGAHDEIQIRGPNVFMGYLNQPEQTAQMDAYKARFGSDAEIGGLQGWFVMDMFIRTLEKAGPALSTDAFVKALESTTFPRSFLGTPEISFGPKKRLGNNQARIAQVQNGRWVNVTDFVR